MTAQAVERSVHVYHALLHLYPAEHRAEYGPHMLQVFGDCCRDAYRERQAAGLRDLWLSTALDLVRTALEERTRRGLRMTRDGFVRLSFLAALLGGLLWTAGFLLMASRPPGTDRGSDLAGLQLACLLLFILACLGHALSRTRRGPKLLAVGAALLAGAGSLVLIATLVLLGYDMPEAVWALTYRSFMVMCAGYALTGLNSARSPALRWPGLLLMAAAPLVPFMNTSNGLVWLGLPLGLAWAWYGLAGLTRRPRVPAPVPS